jgi:hypothetical protein
MTTEELKARLRQAPASWLLKSPFEKEVVGELHARGEREFVVSQRNGLEREVRA